MSLPAAASLVVLLVAAAPRAADRPPATPRLLVKVAAEPGAGQVRATVENLAPVALALQIVPAFALRPSEAQDAGRPAFRAPVDLGTAKPLTANGRMDLRLAARARQAVVVPLESLYWDIYESVFWPSRPLRRVVLPGRYNLILEIEDPASAYWWRSDPISVVVKKAGNLQIGP